MSDDELPAAIEFVRKHGATTSRDVVESLVAKCDRLAAENKEIRLHNEKLAEDFAHSAIEYRELCKVFDERDRLAIELDQANNTAATACKRFAEVSAELAELQAACTPFAECARAVDMYGNLNPMPEVDDCRRIAALLARTPEAVATPPV